MEAVHLTEALSECRKAVNRFWTYELPDTRKKAPPFLYWGNGRNDQERYSAIRRLMALSPKLMNHSMEYNGTGAYMQKFAASVRKQVCNCGTFSRPSSFLTGVVHVQLKANDERSIQFRELKKLFLSRKSIYRFAYGVYHEDKQDKNPVTTMTLASDLTTSLKSVKDLRNLLFSERMYTNPIIFEKFCSGIESGELRDAPVRRRASIDEYLTIAFEAHFRLELWYALSYYGFTHEMSVSHTEERKKYWKQLCQIVQNDRFHNLATAWDKRKRAEVPITEEEGYLSEIQDDPESDIDDAYW